jgi:uncharacterized membrane protein YkvI
MTKKTATQGGILAAFNVSAVWFATHVGGGFATGRQGVQFFTRFGTTTFWLPIFSMTLLAIVFYFAWDFARVFKTRNYRAFCDALYAPVQKFASPLFDIGFIIVIPLAAGAAIAGGGNVIGTILGVSIPLWLGYIIMAVVVYIFASFSLKLVLNAASYMSIGIIIAVIAIVATRLPQVDFEGVPTPALFGPSFFKSPVWFALLYATFQSMAVGSYVSVSESLKSRKDVMQAALIGWIMNALMLVLMNIMILGDYPAINSEAVPTIAILNSMNVPVLKYAYNIMLLMALITTAVSMTYAASKRWATMFVPAGGQGKWADESFRQKTWVVIWIVVSWAISNFGLTAIVAKGYGFLGYIGIPLVLLPLLLVAPRKIKKAEGSQD